jgi:Cell wall hydrolyses involved in spore germination
VVRIGAGIGAVLWAVILFLPMPSAAEMLSLGGRLVEAPAGSFANPDSGRADNMRRQGWLAASGRSSDADEEECLARNVYFEAGGESFSGKVAVAAVTLNRANDPRYPQTICGVVHQRRGGCQFSWMCNGQRFRTPRGEAWDDSREVANILLHTDWFDPTDGALFFHATYVRPRWSRVLPVSARIGRHIFYRDRWDLDDSDEEQSPESRRLTASNDGPSAQ